MELDEVFGVSIFSAVSLIIYIIDSVYIGADYSAVSLIIYIIDSVYIGADYTAVWVSMSCFLTTTSSTSYYKTPYFLSKMVRA